MFRKNGDELNRNLHKHINVAKDLRFNSSKCNVKTRPMRFWAAVYNEKIMRLDRKKVEDIQSLKFPLNVVELQHILKMVTYLATFIPKLSQQVARLRNLLKQDRLFVWAKIHEKTFRPIKALINKETTLACFNQTRLTFMQVDVHGKLLETTLIKECKAVRIPNTT